MRKYKIEDINLMEKSQFVETLGCVFEHSEWIVAESFIKKPFADVRALHCAMIQTLKDSPKEVQLNFLSAHPDLGGKEAVEGTLTAESTSEQKRAGLDSLSPDEFKRIGELNSAYRKKHGFPFIACVRHYTKQGIFYEFERRINKDTEEEFKTALEQIGAITFLRLSGVVE